ncbi:MAG TPA: high-potential iron-sulfur protein [Caldimonas sp.]
MMTSRRSFLQLIPAAGAALTIPGVSAQTLPMVDEKDPQAVALGYVADAKRVDKAKFPKYALGQQCTGCQLFQGAATAAAAPCTLFVGKQVAGPGWCSAFVKKAG